MSPELELHDCQELLSLDLSAVESRLKPGLARVMSCASGPEEDVLDDLPAVEMSVLDDAAIADVHGRFMDDPTATDVITFQHGEILVSAETAAREAAGRQWPTERELLLYLIHGLLHLRGYGDLVEDRRKAMHALQDEILTEIWPLEDSASS